MDADRSTTASEDHQLGQFIPLHYHWTMLQDETRVEAFRETIERFIRPGMNVVELGAGTGILSSFAARQGARVRCVERHPEMVETARRLLELNGLSDRVEVIQGDARNYVPDAPVDAVICEMLHVALLRERQIEVIEAFKRHYQARFAGPLPRFIPEASILTFQPVEQSFEFSGYVAPVPLFQVPTAHHDRTRELAPPLPYSRFFYDESLPHSFVVDETIAMESDGCCNALRFMTQNLIGIVPEEGRGISWANQFLVWPLETPIMVHVGDQLQVTFSYEAGAPLSALSSRLNVIHLPRQARRAA